MELKLHILLSECSELETVWAEPEWVVVSEWVGPEAVLSEGARQERWAASEWAWPERVGSAREGSSLGFFFVRKSFIVSSIER